MLPFSSPPLGLLKSLAFDIKPGKPLPEELTHENTDHVTAGATNMVAQIKNLTEIWYSGCGRA